MKNDKIIDNLLKKFIKSTLFLFLFLISSKALTYVYRILIARKLGPEVYGLFTLSLVFIGILIAVSSLGIPKGIIRFFAFYRGRKQISDMSYLIKFFSIFLFILGSFFAILLYLNASFIAITLFNNHRLDLFLKWFSLLIPLSCVWSIFLSVIESFEMVQNSSFIRNVLDNFIKVSSISLLFVFGFMEEALIFSYILGILISFFVTYLIYRKHITPIFAHSKHKSNDFLKIKKEIWNYSWPLMFSGIISFLFLWIDTFMLGIFKSVSDVGIYNAAVPLANLLTIIPLLFIQLFLPVVTKKYAEKNFKVINLLTKQISAWIFFLNLPVLVLILFFPDKIINLFFGPLYSSAVQPLRFLSIGVFFYSISILSENILSMSGRSKTILINTFVAAIVNFILNILLIPKYGLNGAAFSTMVSYILWGLLFIMQAKLSINFYPLSRGILKFSMSIIPSIFLLFFLNHIFNENILNTLIASILFIIIYILFTILFKGFNKNDFMIFDAIKKKIIKQVYLK